MDHAILFIVCGNSCSLIVVILNSRELAVWPTILDSSYLYVSTSICWTICVDGTLYKLTQQIFYKVSSVGGSTIQIAGPPIQIIHIDIVC